MKWNVKIFWGGLLFCASVSGAEPETTNDISFGCSYGGDFKMGIYRLTDKNVEMTLSSDGYVSGTVFVKSHLKEKGFFKIRLEFFKNEINGTFLFGSNGYLETKYSIPAFQERSCNFKFKVPKEKLGLFKEYLKTGGSFGNSKCYYDVYLRPVYKSELGSFERVSGDENNEGFWVKDGPKLKGFKLFKQRIRGQQVWVRDDKVPGGIKLSGARIGGWKLWVKIVVLVGIVAALGGTIFGVIFGIKKGKAKKRSSRGVPKKRKIGDKNSSKEKIDEVKGEKGAVGVKGSLP